MDQDAIMALMESLVSTVFSQVAGVELAAPFRRLTYAEAMEKYGSGGEERTRDGTEPTRRKVSQSSGWLLGTATVCWACSSVR